MKYWKKLSAILLCLVLVMSLSVAAFADEGDGSTVAEETTESAEGMEADAAEETESETGIIDSAELDAMMQDYSDKWNLAYPGSTFSVGFTYLATGDSWYWNADEWMYSASLYKVPACMKLAEEEAAGQINQESMILGYTVEYLERTALEDSNNDSGHAIVEYLGGTYQGKGSDQYIEYTSLPEDYFSDQDFYDYSYYTARFMNEVMQTLYAGGDAKYPHVLEHLKVAQPNNYFHLYLGDTYEIAQKYGSYTEKSGAIVLHTSGIIYTPNPIIVTVMTRQIGNPEYRIADVASMLTDYALTLDEKLPDYQKAQAEKEQKAAEEAAAAEAAAAAEKAAAEQAAAAAAAVTAAPIDTTSQGQMSFASEALANESAGTQQKSSGIPGGIIVFIVVIVVLIVAAILLKVFKGKIGLKFGAKDEDEDYYSDEDDDDKPYHFEEEPVEEEEEEKPAPVARKVRSYEPEESAEETVSEPAVRGRHAASEDSSAKKNRSFGKSSNYIPKH